MAESLPACAGSVSSIFLYAPRISGMVSGWQRTGGAPGGNGCDVGVLSYSLAGGNRVYSGNKVTPLSQRIIFLMRY